MTARVLLTGRPGVGKTTVVRKVVEAAGPEAAGFSTEEIREGGRRVGFRVTDLRSKAEAILAHVDFAGGPRVGKYGVDVAAFERIGVAALERALEGQGCLVIDEIGKMELCCERFRRVVAAAFDSPCRVLATIPLLRHPLLDGLRRRDDVALVEVTLANRRELPRRIAALLGLGTGAGAGPAA